jgi:hypothetical protein
VASHEAAMKHDMMIVDTKIATVTGVMTPAGTGIGDTMKMTLDVKVIMTDERRSSRPSAGAVG